MFVLPLGQKHEIAQKNHELCFCLAIQQSITYIMNNSHASLQNMSQPLLSSICFAGFVRAIYQKKNITFINPNLNS